MPDGRPWKNKKKQKERWYMRIDLLCRGYYDRMYNASKVSQGLYETTSKLRTEYVVSADWCVSIKDPGRAEPSFTAPRRAAK